MNVNLYTDFNDFYRKRKIIKILYQSTQENRLFKKVVYSNANVDVVKKDAIWEYLNGDELKNLRVFLK